MNPYDFVRVEWQQPGVRRDAPPQDRFSGMSGRLEATITTLTPLFIPDKRSYNPGGNAPQQFLCDQQGRAIIPGSSLKGLFRSLVETVGGGAWWFFGGKGVDGTWRDRTVQGGMVDYSHQFPRDFKRPRSREELDAACRMFGFLNSSQTLAGSVGCEDAICAEPRFHDPIYTCILSTPKPRHRVWYLDDQQRWVRGRKFYFHSTALQTAAGWLPHRDALPKQRQNAYIQPIDAGSIFTFQVRFTSVAADDFALLLYTLALEPDMRHKLGYAKPAGLGSIEVQVNWIEIVDYMARYRAGGGGGYTRYERREGQDDTLTPFVQAQTEPYTTNRTSITLQDLRRIWQWPAVHEQRYPARDWFNQNPNTPLRDTP
jgi:CRISPR/Cas system CSM-associated protein Csm3 (group 7 of RAMP superfamily)